MKCLLVSLLCLGLLSFTACKQMPKKESLTKPAAKELKQPDEAAVKEPLAKPTPEDLGQPDEIAVIETDLGEIVLEFFPDVAPMHVANFKKLAKAGFYDGTTFHRVISGFMIQGGDPNSKDDNPYNDGTGGPPWNIEAEFSETPHDKGILSMARSRDINSAGSQFFICLSREKTKQLDGQYTVFGKVIKGIEVVEKIGAMNRDPRKDAKNPAVMMKKVTIVKKETK